MGAKLPGTGGAGSPGPGIRVRRLYTVQVNYHDGREQWHWVIYDYRGHDIDHGFTNHDDEHSWLKAHEAMFASLMVLMGRGPG